MRICEFGCKSDVECPSFSTAFCGGCERCVYFVELK